MASFRELLSQVKSQIREVDTAGADAFIDTTPNAVVLDVREPDEYEQGALPNAVHIPRGNLESQIENKVAERDVPIVVYCAGGTRSAFAAKTLADLGYENVTSANPGFVRWKDLRFPVETPPSLSEAQRDRYSRHLLLPEIGDKGQAKLLASRVLLLGA